MQLHFLILHPPVVYTDKRFICLRIFYLKVIIIILIIIPYLFKLNLKKKNINKSWPYLFQNESTVKQMAFPLSETKVEIAYVDNWWRKLIYEFTLLNYETIVVVSLSFCLYLKKKPTISRTNFGQTNTCTCNIQLVVLWMCTFNYIMLTYILQKIYTNDEWIFGWKCS